MRPERGINSPALFFAFCEGISAPISRFVFRGASVEIGAIITLSVSVPAGEEITVNIAGLGFHVSSEEIAATIPADDSIAWRTEPKGKNNPAYFCVANVETNRNYNAHYFHCGQRANNERYNVPWFPFKSQGNSPRSYRFRGYLLISFCSNNDQITTKR